MRETVPEENWEVSARGRGEAAVTDLRLYNEIFQRHYIQAFNEFCSHHGLELLVAPMEGKDLDISKYVEKQVLRREALNLFILQKPHVVMHEERCFIITFLSEIDIRIFEITVAELAEFANAVLVGQRSPIAKLKLWHRTRRLRRRLRAILAAWSAQRAPRRQ